MGTVVVLDGTRVVARSPLVADREVAAPGMLRRARYLSGRTARHLLGWLGR